MRLREKPLRPWVIAGKDGVVKAAHCTCLVGLGEDCSHVAALLFCIDATVRIRDSKTVTENPAYWMLPSLGITRNVCMKVDVSVEQAKEVELATRTQSKSKLWYRFRAGRITALKAKSACNTDPSKQSQSLVKAIGY